ncbi:T-cell surface glycoprotein CD8 alpha chain isoform X2 [Rhinatrema bivittatum]|uniref:T-cell surface glycoprotein CD8 alpha chain isoform X2 n=1 Tax=Rhinatrema bivittatum TaxID=194408 RepID=UPI0011288384|nr:T-cell surface glycoprotein CD8 alpha chain isoform X2 [Rhinatrema bivittatum]
MAKLIAVLLFLHLLWRPSSQQLELRQGSDIVQGGSGKLQCSSKKNPALLDQGVFWFQQRRSQRAPTFLFYINSLGRVKANLKIDAAQFTVQKESWSYSLEFKSFGEEDQSTYYCLSFYNSELFFSPGVPLYYPGTTLAPTSSSTAAARGPQSSRSPENCSSHRPADSRRRRCAQHCKCKKRPMKEINGLMKPPDRYT